MYSGICVVVALILGASRALGAASAAETREYGVALRFFQDGKYDQAEKELAEFIRKHSTSESVAEAALLQAQCRYELAQYEAAVLLLREHIPNAATLADLYRYWLAESLFQVGNYPDAARSFNQVLAEYPASARRLEAALGEAFSYYKLGDLKRCLTLLLQAEGAFQKTAALRPDDNGTVRGRLLQAEVGLSLNDLDAVEDALDHLVQQSLRTELSWQRQYLLGRLQLRREQLDPALATVSGLLTELNAAATNSAAVGLKPDAVALQGRVQEMKGDADGAIRTYQLNLDPATPREQRLQAVQRTLELTVAQDSFGDSAARLEPFVVQNAADPTLDVLRLALGELRLKAYYQLNEASRSADTNFIRLAASHFDQVLANTNNQLAARAQLDRGWCLWEEAVAKGNTNRLREGLAAFDAAAGLSPRGSDQAVARFKAADCLFKLGDYSGAITNYFIVTTNYIDLPAVKDGLVPQALYQLTRAAIAVGAMDAAEGAVRKILAEYPEIALADRSALLFGEAASRLHKPSAARVFFADFLARFPKSALAPEIQFAIVRSFEQERDWVQALAGYEAWVTNHVGHALAPQVEFGRAWANYLGGNETNAFNLFTNYVVQFQGTPLSVLAQNWVGNHHFRHEQFDMAEADFQRIAQNTNVPTGLLSHQSLLMAGRSAFRRQGYSAAVSYFTKLINDPSCPPALLPDAYFALADTFIEYPETSATATNSIDKYKEALVALEKIVTSYPTNRVAPMAWGRIGDCYFQRKPTDPRFYKSAVDAYTNAMAHALADVGTRSQAEVGLALVLEKQAESASRTERQALLDQALNLYMNVVEGGNLRDQEVADPFWVKKSAVEAARLAKDLQQWNVARNLYARLISLVPAMRPTWEARIEELLQARPEPPPGTPESGK